jgi:glycogen debranching enzyme
MAETRVTEGHDDLARVLMHQDTFAVFDRAGAVCSDLRQEQGVYHRGTRYVSRLDLRIDGERPMTLSSSVVRDNALLAVDLTNPELSRDGKTTVPHGTIHLYRGCVIEDGVCHQRLRAHNFSADEISFELQIRLEADFADVFEVRGTPRSRRGRQEAPEKHADGISITYRGLDGVLRQTRLRCNPAPSQVHAKEVRFSLRLGPREERELTFEVSCTEDGRDEPMPPFGDVASRRDAEQDALRDQEARVHSSSGLFDGWLHRAQSDLRMLLTRTKEGLYPYAGVPWYSTPFGRDGIITALQMLWTQPEVAAGVTGDALLGRGGRRAGQDRPRDAPRRDGGAPGGSLRPVLRRGGHDPSVPRARRRVPPRHRRSGIDPEALAPLPGGTRVDRAPRRPRRGRLRRVRPALP